MTTINNPLKSPTIPRILFSIVGGLVLFALGAAALIGGYQYTYKDLIYPGTSIAGIDVSGLTRAQAATRIINEIKYPTEGQLALQDQSTTWVVTPAELGMLINADANAQMAYDIGRTAEPLYAMRAQLGYASVDLPPLFIYDERIALDYLQGLAGTINVPTIEATLGLEGVAVNVNTGQVGRTLDIATVLEQIPAQLQSMQDGLIPLIVNESPPIILDASAQAAVAEEILRAPLVIRDPDAAPDTPVEWVIEPEILAGMLTVEKASTTNGGAEYQIRVSTNQLTAFLESIAAGLSKTPQNARFIFNDDTRQLEVIEKSITGRELLVAESVAYINEQLAIGEHNIALVFDYTLPPANNNSTAEELGITELVVEQTSYFYGSSPARITNIKVAAARFHGLLVAPGETVSMAEVLGDIELDTGYAEALIIYGDRTIKGVGGGVCQVSTTLFRTAFFGGYQIDKRNPHAYRVYYYELAANGTQNISMAGLDATVYVPLVDFKFTNDSDSWLLMETYVTDTSITWKFYSTDDGREVEWHSTGLQNKTPAPESLYEENKELAPGVIKQVDWAVAGGTVTITRTVTRDGEVISDDIFTTNYRPWRSIYQYGPGTKLPKGANTGE